MAPPRRDKGVAQDQMKPLRDNLKESYDKFQQKVRPVHVENIGLTSVKPREME